ncbi:unnamed protein product [Arctogadus glacialis]
MEVKLGGKCRTVYCRVFLSGRFVFDVFVLLPGWLAGQKGVTRCECCVHEDTFMLHAGEGGRYKWASCVIKDMLFSLLCSAFHIVQGKKDVCFFTSQCDQSNGLYLLECQ